MKNTAKKSRKTPVIDPYLPNSGNFGYRVSRYELDVEYKVASNRLSGTATITAAGKLAQSIVFAPLADRLSNSGTFALSATSSSGLPVSFTVISGPALLSGANLTLTGVAGTVVVRASQAGNAVYNAARDQHGKALVQHGLQPQLQVGPPRFKGCRKACHARQKGRPICGRFHQSRRYQAHGHDGHNMFNGLHHPRAQTLCRAVWHFG